MATVTIHGFAPSTYTQSVRMVSSEVGIESELAGLEFQKPSHFALHPFGKMPVLSHGDVHVYETLAIITYLDDTFNESQLQPRSSSGRATMLQSISAAIDYVYPSLVGGLHEPSPEGLSTAAATLKILDAQCGTYLVNDEPTLADFVLFPMVSFALGKLADPKPTGIKRLMRWHQRMAKRKSAKVVS